MIRKLLNKIQPVINNNSQVVDIDSLKMMYGSIASGNIDFSKPFFENEFSVFSQWGDDGIIQYLIKQVNIQNDFFVEFGVENYYESNTRFLMEHDNWSGLVFDGSEKNIQQVKAAPFFWKHELKAVHSFITSENINKLLQENLTTDKIGLLHIDIDGMDYWVWEAITLRPDIVIVEYNALFGYERAITIPYDKDFFRTAAHFSNLYAGASLAALENLGQRKGYDFIGCNRAGNNAYFIVKEKSEKFNKPTLEEGFVMSKFRESRDPQGGLTYISGRERLDVIKGLTVFNVISGNLEVI
jgi:hypothetical protein